MGKSERSARPSYHVALTLFAPLMSDRLSEKGSRKKGSQAGDEDSSSIASASTLSSVTELGYDQGSAIEDDPFEVAIDALYEKRCGESAFTP